MTPIIYAATSLSNFLASYFDHQSVKIIEQQKTIRTEIAAGVVKDGLQTLQLIASAYIEYRQVVEQEHTQRREIEAWEKEAIARIEAQREALITYLNRSFDEREKNFAFLFDLAERAIATGNSEQLASVLNSITAIAKTNPLEPLSNYSSFQAKLADPNYEWKF